MKARNIGEKMYEDEKAKEEADAILLKSVGSTIVKVVLCIGICVTAGIVFSNCGIDKDTIQECKAACSPQDMQSATMFSCQCSYGTQSSNDWVIPRSKSSSR